MTDDQFPADRPRCRVCDAPMPADAAIGPMPGNYWFCHNIEQEGTRVIRHEYVCPECRMIDPGDGAEPEGFPVFRSESQPPDALGRSTERLWFNGEYLGEFERTLKISDHGIRKGEPLMSAYRAEWDGEGADHHLRITLADGRQFRARGATCTIAPGNWGPPSETMKRLKEDRPPPLDETPKEPKPDRKKAGKKAGKDARKEAGAGPAAKETEGEQAPRSLFDDDEE